MFAGVDDQGVVFIEERCVGRKASLEKGADMVVRFFTMEEVVAFEYAARVGIHDKDGALPGVEKDRVSGLRADAVNREELLTKLGSGRGE